MYMLFFFFFQAEDGIRDGHVTGVQTCALPISTPRVVSKLQRPTRIDSVRRRRLASRVFSIGGDARRCYGAAQKRDDPARVALRFQGSVGPDRRRGQPKTQLSPVPPLQSPSVPGAPFGRP